MSTPRFLVIGESLVDIVRSEAGATVEHVGGSPANVAMGLARLGHDTGFLTALGDDERGHRIAEHVTGHGVTLLSRYAVESTSTAAVTFDEAGNATYDFDLRWDLPTVDVAGFGHVHTGSIATTLEPGAGVVDETVRRARAGATVSYDPNVRPAIMGEPDGIRSRVEELVASSDVVKASSDDLELLYPGESPASVMDRWLALGASLVVTTLGSDGVTWRAASGGVASAPVRDGTVVDTIGAGDSFMAGLLSGLAMLGLVGSASARGRLTAADTEAVRSAINRGLAASAVTVARPGAYAPTSGEIEADPKESR